MKTNLSYPIPHSDSLGHVHQLSDAVLRRSHALLDDSRIPDLSGWMDEELDRLEARFDHFTTPGSFRKSMGR